MHIRFLATLAALTVLSAPVLAGTMTYADGKPSWHPTQCTEPPAPPSLLRAHREMSAEKMNILMTQYNQYTMQMQTYMDCISNEAQTDSTASNQAITGGAQNMINEAQQKVNTMGAGLKNK